MTTTPHVHLVDDDEAVRDGIGALLDASGYTVHAFGSGRAFLDAAPSLPDGCVLLDLRMPDLSGLEVQAEMQRRGITLPVIFLTAHGDVSTGVSAMKHGAVDFLQKPVRDAALHEALRHATDRLRADEARLRTARTSQALIETLTPREFEVIALVVEGLRSRAIAQRLGITVQTTKVHRMRAMAKLQVSTPMQLGELWRATKPTPPRSVMQPR